MLRLCFEYPGRKKLNDSLVVCFSTNDIVLDSDIFYKQWVSTDRTTLASHYSTVEEFISKTIDDFYELCSDHIVSKAQGNHLKTAKENLFQNKVIILLDFAEIYSLLFKMLSKIFTRKTRCPKFSLGKVADNTSPFVI